MCSWSLPSINLYNSISLPITPPPLVYVDGLDTDVDNGEINYSSSRAYVAKSKVYTEDMLSYNMALWSNQT